jgi:hypothetical protein
MKWLEPILYSGRGGGGRGRGERATYLPPKIISRNFIIKMQENKKISNPLAPLDFLTTPSTPSKEPENYWESLL